MDGNVIFFSLLFSVIGIGFFTYGKKNNVYFMVAGLGLMLYPYTVASLASLIIIGIVLVVLPFVLSNFIPL